MRDCTLLITTRPRKKDELRPGSDAQFEINGFDQWQVETFVRKFLRDQTEVLKFTAFLTKCSLWDLAEIPLLLLMLVLSWKVSDYQGPSTSRALLYSNLCQTLLDHVTAKTSGETFRSIDEYKEDLAKLGELAWQALLTDCVYFKLSNLPEDIRLLIEKFIDFGFLQTSNPTSSPRPERLAFFLHKSVQEFISALFIVRDLKNAKEAFNCLSKVDSVERFKELFEVFKFVSELSSEATFVVFSHLKKIGEKKSLTDNNFYENLSVEKPTVKQTEFYLTCLDFFLSCPASDTQTAYPSFLQTVNGVIVIDVHDKHLSTVATEHCLRSTSSHKPDYVFFVRRYQFDAPRDWRDQMFSVMSDLNTVIVTCYGDVKSVNRYHDVFPHEFFIKMVGHQSVFYLTRPEFTRRTSPKFIELLRSLTSAPKSSLHEPDHVSQNHDVCSSLQLTEKTSDQTLTHSLSYLREIAIEGEIEGPTSELVILLNNLRHVPRLSTLILSAVGMGNQECQLLATALKYVDKLRSLMVSHNPLGHGISELANHLHSVPYLEELNLNDTQMGEEEVTALAHSLKNVTQLGALYLSDNPLGHGISELAKHLHNVPHLKTLTLNDTQIGEEEITALARSMVYAPKLMYLQLDKNPLGRGVSELIKCLSSRPQLPYLSLTHVRLTKKEATELYTLANERNMDLKAEYHVSFSLICTLHLFYFPIINARNTQELSPG